MNEKSGYTTYPAELEKLTRKTVTRAGAASMCKKLADLGILQLTKKRSPTWSESTPHYSLQEDVRAFIKLTRLYFQTLAKSDPYSWQLSAGHFMNSQYARRQINSSLVRNVLSTKKVEMPLYLKTGTEIKNQEIVFERLRDHIPLSFPVMPSHAKIDEMSSKVIIHSNELTDYQKEIIPNIIENHYRDVEENTLILPILALLQISPTALIHFLSNWKPYVRDDDCISFSASSQGFDMVEHILFRLVWGAITDLSMTRAVPDRGNVFMAEISGGNLPSGKPAPLLRVLCHDNLSFEYEAGFDTNHLIYGDELLEIVTNPENCSVKINWRKERGPETTLK